MLFADRDVAGPRNVNRHAALEIRAEYLEHPGLANSAAPVECHSLGGGRKNESGFELERTRL